MAKMAQYRPYLPAAYHESFDSFLKFHAEYGSDLGIGDPRSMRTKLDANVVEAWETNVIEKGRLDGISDPARRLEIMGAEGVGAEVLFPDFGLPFELPPRTAQHLGYVRTDEQVRVGATAHNRWLVDFCSTAPERFIGMAVINFDDVDAAIAEIRWAKDAGLKGIVLPSFTEEVPLYDERHDPIWRTLAELEMPVNSHIATSMTTTRTFHMSTDPHIGCGMTIYQSELFFVTRQLLTHMIWGGVLERHPNLSFVMTEVGSGWVPGALDGMDYAYEGSYLPRDLQRVLRLKPSEYFERQVHLGSSIFSRFEIESRHQIGVHKMMLGMDYPHHEGTWAAGPGTLAYLQSTLGVGNVPPEEATQMLSGNAQRVFNLDGAALDIVRQNVGFTLRDVLTSPGEPLYARGDVNKPIGASVA